MNPEELRYTKEHEWAKVVDGTIAVGITHHAQDALGDIVYLELPDEGANLSEGGSFGVVESIKAVSDLFSPIEGEVAAVNSELVDSPEKINEDPYGDAWMIKLRCDDPEAAINTLMTKAEYEEFLKTLQ